MSMRGLRAALLLALFLFAAPALFAQNTTLVSGTIADPNGFAYTNAKITVSLSPASPGGAYCNGTQINGPWGTSTTQTGAFSIALCPNASITPGGSQWLFTVTMAPGVLPPVGTGPQTFSQAFTISGSTQTLTFSSVPALTNISSSGGNVSSVFGRTGAVVAQLGDYSFSLISGQLNLATQASGILPIANFCLTQPGIFYPACYTGTPDQMYTSCEAAARAYAGGGTCDTRVGLSGTQAFANPVSCGDTAGDPVGIIWPTGATWNFTLTGGTQWLFTHYMDCTTQGYATGEPPMFTIHNSSAPGGAFGGYHIATGSTTPGFFGYFRACDFYLQQNGSTSSYAGGVSLLIDGGEDNSLLCDGANFDPAATDTALVQFKPSLSSNNPCCSITIRNFASNASYTGGIPLDIEGVSSGPGAQSPNAINIDGGSWNHPGPGLPEIKCNDPNGLAKVSVAMTAVTYMELNHDTGTPAIESNNCRAFSIENWEAVAEVAGTNKSPALFTSTNAFNTNIKIGRFNGRAGDGNFIYPFPIVSNGFTGSVVMSDANGQSGGYDSITHNFEAVNIFGLANIATQLLVGVTGTSCGTNLACFGTTSQGIINSAGDFSSSGYIESRSATVGVNSRISTSDDGSGGNLNDFGCNTTSGQQCAWRFGRFVNTTGPKAIQLFHGDGTATIDVDLTDSVHTSYILANLALGTTGSGCGNQLCIGSSNQFQVDSSGNVAAGKIKAGPGGYQFLAAAPLLDPGLPTLAGFSSGGATFPVTPNGAVSFRINVGTGTMQSTGTITFANTASSVYNCDAHNITAWTSTSRNDETKAIITGRNGTTLELLNKNMSTGAAVLFTASDEVDVICAAD